jgi:hypothetical protein
MTWLYFQTPSLQQGNIHKFQVDMDLEHTLFNSIYTCVFYIGMGILILPLLENLIMAVILLKVKLAGSDRLGWERLRRRCL